MRRAVLGWSLALALAAGCAATGRDPWQRAQEVFRDGDVAGFVDVRRKQRDVTLAWCGVRSQGERRLTAVRMVLFSDTNGDQEPQSEERLAVWDARSPTAVTEFTVDAAFRSSNVPVEVLEHLSVWTEVEVEGQPEPLRQVRKLP